jgi:hypothetical protein
MTSICISGGRDYILSEKGIDALIKLFIYNFYQEEILLIEGGSRGIDSCIDEQLQSFFHLAEEEDWHFIRKTLPADWDKFGNSAGPIRNEKMADICDVGILFPGGNGTNNMYLCLKKNNKKIIDFRKNTDYIVS